MSKKPSLMKVLVDALFDTVPDKMNQVFQTMIGFILAAALDTKTLIESTRHVLQGFPVDVDEDFVNRFSVALYVCASMLTLEDMRTSMGLVNTAFHILQKSPENVSLERFTEKTLSKEQKISPSMTKAVTPDVIQLAGRMYWVDLIRHGEPQSTDQMRNELHIYFEAAAKHYGLYPDPAVVAVETRQFMEAASAADLESFPPEFIELMKNFEATTNGQQPDGSETIQ